MLESKEAINLSQLSARIETALKLRFDSKIGGLGLKSKDVITALISDWLDSGTKIAQSISTRSGFKKHTDPALRQEFSAPKIIPSRRKNIIT